MTILTSFVPQTIHCVLAPPPKSCPPPPPKWVGPASMARLRHLPASVLAAAAMPVTRWRRTLIQSLNVRVTPLAQQCGRAVPPYLCVGLALRQHAVRVQSPKRFTAFIPTSHRCLETATTSLRLHNPPSSSYPPGHGSSLISIVCFSRWLLLINRRRSS